MLQMDIRSHEFKFCMLSQSIGTLALQKTLTATEVHHFP